MLQNEVAKKDVSRDAAKIRPLQFAFSVLAQNTCRWNDTAETGCCDDATMHWRPDELSKGGASTWGEISTQPKFPRTHWPLAWEESTAWPLRAASLAALKACASLRRNLRACTKKWCPIGTDYLGIGDIWGQVGSHFSSTAEAVWGNLFNVKYIMNKVFYSPSDV